MRLIKLALALVVLSSVAAGAAGADSPTTVNITIQDAVLTSENTVLVTGTAPCPNTLMSVSVNEENDVFGQGQGVGTAVPTPNGHWAADVHAIYFVKDKATVTAALTCSDPFGTFNEERTMLIHD